MIEKKYRHMFDQISPEPQLVEEMCAKAGRQKKSEGMRAGRGRMLRTAVACAALVLAVFAGMPLLAESAPQVYRVIQMVSPAAAQFFRPVKKSCVYDGIKMEVESVYIHEETAEIYVSMQDLEGDRIDATTDLFDSYSIDRPFESVSGCAPIGYEEETGKAVFLIRISQWGNRKIEGDKITFSVREFLSHKEKWEELKVNMDLEQQAQEKASRKTRFLGGGMDNEKFSRDEDGMVSVLEPGEPLADFPVDGIDITQAGYVDGLFHVQALYYDRGETDNHCFLYLKDAQGNTVDCIANIYHVTSQEDRLKRDYVDFVFDVSEKDLKNYELYGDFVTCGSHCYGLWQVTFPLEVSAQEQ